MNSLFLSYVPVVKKSYRTLLSLDAQIKVLIGRPMRFAKVRRQDVAEVSGGHGDVDLLAFLDLAVLK